MDRKEMEDQVIQSYQKDEQMMILVFAQWCINHELDPVSLYKEAYPDQIDNDSLRQALELTVSKKEAEDIPDQTLLGVLSLFGNDDLAFVVTEYMDKRK
ncbi:hypothetical protein MUO14_11630 [Halobacillus shinanisalinarum]|uniref:YxiS n=1 Tax=Halobacillus shinanisalinarum TaxID=2932258 RepID=A0ABY4H5S3_9BACI|nr:hypothetical protein [Halobacillus shinanisalinarum]UOQ95508.1 hypothetical protein MUO14_11630 [Halobacillus shinanisalinarum]